MREFRTLVAEIGSSRIRAAIFDACGNKKSLASVTTRFEFNKAYAEFDCDLWFSELIKVMKGALERAQATSVDGICVSSCGPASVFLDKNLNPVRKGILWMDSRAVAESAFLSDKIARYIPPAFPVSLALWLKYHEQRSYEQIAYICQPLDYFSFMLTGRICRSCVSDSFTAFPESAWKAASLPDSILPEKIFFGELIGNLKDRFASLLSLPAGIPVYAGSGGADVIETLLGTSCFDCDILCDKTGTSEGLEAVSIKKVEDKGVFSVLHPFLKGKWHAGAVIASSGKAFEWFLRSFYGENSSFDLMTNEAAGVPAGSGDLVFLPYLAGERGPIGDPDAKGVFFGLRLSHSRRDLARAVMEGIGFALRQIVDVFRKHGISPKIIRVGGSPSRNSVWNSIKADILNIPFQPVCEPETELLGLSLITAVASGLYGNFIEASKKIVKFKDIVCPNDAHRDVYDRIYSKYISLYPALAKFF